MNIQRFTAPTSREAMAKARNAFGDSAVILSTRSTAEGFEVMAAAEESLAPLGHSASPAPITTRPAAETKKFEMWVTSPYMLRWNSTTPTGFPGLLFISSPMCRKVWLFHSRNSFLLKLAANTVPSAMSWLAMISKTAGSPAKAISAAL